MLVANVLERWVSDQVFHSRSTPALTKLPEQE
jgi:hypothetical protein